MARPHRKWRGASRPDAVRRAAMFKMIQQGMSIDRIARLLDYANVQSAYVMAHRWGFHTLLSNSYISRRTRPFKSELYKPYLTDR